MSKFSEEITKKQISQIIEVMSKEAEKEGFDDYWLYGQLLNGDFLIESFFETYFKNTEGPMCCCDKARYVLGAIKTMIQKKENISLQQTYREYKESGGDIGNIKKLDELCYWCPKTIKNSKEAIELFYIELTKLEARNKGIDELIKENQELRTRIIRDYISKDKVIAKIEELDNEFNKRNAEEEDFNFNYGEEYSFAEDKLKELLEGDE